jgi:hypothetical protein
MRKLIVFLLLSCLSLWAQEVKRPTADVYIGTQICGGTWWDASATLIPSCCDGTGATIQVFGEVGGDPSENHESNEGLGTWQTTANSYTALDLIFDSSCSGSNVGSCQIQYSLNGGGSWSTGKSGSTWARTTTTISLSPTQNLANVRVQACSVGQNGNNGGSTGNRTITLFDIKTSGTLSGGGGTNRRRQTTQQE